MARLHIDTWIRELRAELKPASVHRKVSTVRGYYDYAVDEALALERNPIPPTGKRLHLPTVSSKSQTLGPDRTESQALMAAARMRGPLAAAIVTCLLHQGWRVAELYGMNTSDLLAERGHRGVRLHRKGDEIQDQVLSPPAVRALDDYRASLTSGDLRPAVLDPDGEPVFVDEHGRRLNRDQVAHIVEQVTKAAGVDKALTPHSFRHTCATQLLDEGVSIRDVQVYLGHARSSTTERYDLGRSQWDNSPAYALTRVFAV